MLTSTGESRSTSAAPCHGSSAAVRSTPEWHSHDLAELIEPAGHQRPVIAGEEAHAHSRLVLVQGSLRRPAANSPAAG